MSGGSVLHIIILLFHALFKPEHTAAGINVIAVFFARFWIVRIDIVAKQVLEKYLPAFKELAKW